MKFSHAYSGSFCVAAAAYTYYKSLCQDETQKRKGIYAKRKTQCRRRERVVRVSVTRTCFAHIFRHAVLCFLNESCATMCSKSLSPRDVPRGRHSLTKCHSVKLTGWNGGRFSSPNSCRVMRVEKKMGVLFLWWKSFAGGVRGCPAFLNDSTLPVHPERPNKRVVKQSHAYTVI